MILATSISDHLLCLGTSCASPPLCLRTALRQTYDPLRYTDDVTETQAAQTCSNRLQTGIPIAFIAERVHCPS